MNPVPCLLAAVLLLPWLAPVVKAADKLPDRTAAAKFLTSGEYRLDGWWREEFPLELKWPDSLLEITTEAGSPATVRVQRLRGSVQDGKGRVTATAMKKTFLPDGRDVRMELAFDLMEKPVTLICAVAADESWIADLPGLPPGRRIAGPYEAFQWVMDKDPRLDEAIEMLSSAIEYSRLAASPDPALWKVEPDTFGIDGDFSDAWRAVRRSSVYFVLRKSDGKVLRWGNAHRHFRRAPAQAAELLPATMKAIDGPSLRVETVREATIVFYTPDIPPLPSGSWQSVSRDGDRTTVLCGRIEEAEPDTRGDIDEFRKNDESLTSHAAFRALVEKLLERGDPAEPVEAVRRARGLLPANPQPPSRTPFTLAEALEKGGDALTRTRLTVALLRGAGIAAREVHGFLLHPDCLPVRAERRSWVEVLHEGDWHPVDPEMIPAPPSDSADPAETPPDISGLHVKVCHGPPGSPHETFLASTPVVSAQPGILKTASPWRRKIRFLNGLKEEKP